MENMRQKIDLGLQALGCPSQPRKGVVGKDLGRTEFISGPSRPGITTSFRRTKDTNVSESDDELDAFSSKNEYESSTPSSHNPKPLKAKIPNKVKRNVSSSSHHKVRQRSKARKGVDIDMENNSTSSHRRPRPRPAFKTTGSYDSDDNMPPSNQLALETKRTRKISEHDRHGSFPLEELSPNRAKRLKTSKVEMKKAEPAAFPMNIERGVKAKTSSAEPSSRKPAPFPIEVPSSQSSFQKPNPEPFPLESTSPRLQTLQNKNLAVRSFPMEDPFSRDSGSDNADDDLKMTESDMILTWGGPRPFPMSTLQSSPGPALVSNPSARDKGGSASTSLSSPDPSDFGALSLDGDENVDPSTICPYCDEPWPPAPSPTLIALLERTKYKSYPDPRHDNALGLKAPLAAFVELCQRHRFEMTHLPLALARGWPTRIDFASIPRRIKAIRRDLKRLLDRPTESKFWREVRDDAKEVGMMKVVSVTGQYATFERTQPGYYGEQGSIIIHQSLYSLFPPDTISTVSVLPLTPDQFLTRVLVPEAALILIQQDMGLSAKNAMDVLDESKQYGVAMFPEQAQDEEVAEVGEQLARSRAKARRKVLEQRGEADADVRREVEREKRRGKKSTANKEEKPMAQGKANISESDTESELAQEKKIIEGRDYSEDPTPQPTRVASNFWESSRSSWRSTRSPSTSPIPIPMMRSSSPVLDTNKTPPLMWQSTKRTEKVVRSLQWSFKLHDDDFSLEPEHATGGKEAIVSSDHKVIPQTDDEDSDVLMITDTETPRPRSKTHGVITNHSVSSLESGNEVMPHVSLHKSKGQKKYEREAREVVEEEKVKMKASGCFGQTKRRKKGKTTNTMAPPEGRESTGHSWLLSDSDC